MLCTMKSLESCKDWTKNDEKPCETYFKNEGENIIVKGIRTISFSRGNNLFFR